MKHVPYTTKAGVRIGCRWQPPTHMHLSPDQFWLQDVLTKHKRRERLIDWSCWLVAWLLILFVISLVI